MRNDAYINGEWFAGSASFAVHNPANGAHIADVANCTRADVGRAIDAAYAAQPAWAARTAKDRAQILHKWFDLIMQQQESLAALLTREMGKPLAEARGEIAYGASFIEWFAEEAKRVYGDVIPAHGVDKRILVLKQPVGVVAAITPWNFPNAMITRKVAPALAVGCTVVIKPASETPLSALALAELAEAAGIPPGVLNIVTGTDAPEMGLELTQNPKVRKVSFTGSTEVGKILMRQASTTMKRLSLELGGNAPFIVFDDADIDQAVAGAILSKYRNAGQTCVCTNRLLVHSAVHDIFVEKYVAAVTQLKVASGDADGAQIGPLISEEALAKVEELVADATGKGAQVVTGGIRHPMGGTFYTPTVITGVTSGMRVAREEIFDPVAPIFRFESDAEAVRLANDTEFGLAAYFYARDIARVWRVAEQLEYGIIGINEGIISTEVAPFGGMKESGYGREGSKYGVNDFLEIKYLCMGGV